MARKLKTVKIWTNGKTEDCIYFRSQYGQKLKWVAPHKKS